MDSDRDLSDSVDHLESIAILTVLNVLIHEHGVSFHLLRSFNNAQQCAECKWSLLSLFIPLYFLILLRMKFLWLCRCLVEACKIFVASWGSFVAVHRLSSCGTWAAENSGFSNCGTQPQLLCSMWDLSSLTGDQTHIPCIARWILNHWTTRKSWNCFLNFIFRIAYCKCVYAQLTFMCRSCMLLCYSTSFEMSPSFLDHFFTF